MSQPNERTKLLTDTSKPQYVFNSSIARERQRRVKQFQCCLCVIFITFLVTALLIVVVFSINPWKPDTNSTEIDSDALINLFAQTWPLSDEKVETTFVGNSSQWENALTQGQEALQKKYDISKNIKQLPIGSPSYKHQKIFSASNKTNQLSDLGYKFEFARKYFDHNSSKICNRNDSLLEDCNADYHCNVFHKYRTYNGSCNNLKQQFGIAYKPFRRALSPDYADAISAPRVAKDGKGLPSARTVSLKVHRPYYKNDDKFSVVLAVWGQFLDHDMTATALNHGINGTSISCCLSNQTYHPECFPVCLDSSDPNSIYNITCMEFVRSAPAPSCCLSFREQMNQVTSFIDGSVIYSVDEEVVQKLRTLNGGQLDMYFTEDNRTLLPISKDMKDGCNRIEENQKGRYCFMTGDIRANENLHLTSMHLIWARQHNLLARQLSEINRDWNDEKIFQEARKILGAQMQHITYNEFLPILLGPAIMEKFDLYPKKSGYFEKYDEDVDASIANNFATAAFRFAHSIIPSLMKFLSKDSSSHEFVQLHKMLFDPFRLYQPGELDRALKSAIDTSIEANDPYFSNELKEHLFEDKTSKMCGLDLVSLNIQRGRDHGLAGYNRWREHCGLRRVSDFDQLQGNIDDDSLENVKSIYRDVDDVDLYTGALSEKPLNGSILGPTITCLILDQFIRVKFGDRFWYENSQSFSPVQLDEIRKTSLAKIICDNADNVAVINPLVMEKIRSGNDLTPCTNLPHVSLDHWKDKLVHINFTDNTMSVTIRN